MLRLSCWIIIIQSARQLLFSALEWCLLYQSREMGTPSWLMTMQFCDIACSTAADFVGCDVQTKDGMKMGKSLGNVLEPGPLVAAYGHDAVRFFFLKEVIFGQVSTRQCHSHLCFIKSSAAAKRGRPKPFSLHSLTRDLVACGAV